VQVHVVVERRAEAVQEGDGAEPWVGGWEGVGVRLRLLPRRTTISGCGSRTHGIKHTIHDARPKRELREFASFHRKPLRIPSARASGFTERDRNEKGQACYREHPLVDIVRAPKGPVVPPSGRADVFNDLQQRSPLSQRASEQGRSSAGAENVLDAADRLGQKRKRTGISGSAIKARGVMSRKTGIDRRVVGFSGPQSSVRYKSSLEERVR